MNVGTKMIYMGNSRPSLRGQVVEVVKHTQGVSGVTISFPSGDRHYCRIDLLEPLPPPPTESEVAAALAVLKAAGEVVFKPNRPAFPGITVLKINGDYNARIAGGTTVEEVVHIGCNRVTFAKVEELYAAVQKAREYNAGA